MFRRTKIWKLQRPLHSNDDVPMVMAYTEDRENLAMLPMPEEAIDEVFGDERKIYVRARVVNGILKVKRRVAEQDW